ncbi:hypothetical protein [Marinobacterium marinum]|uniref:Uncharacterized protein n=1 Tax=Marinobacterium marinum TaxID=2756129 RepID=A0A7W1WVG7_9GAMM|nr:hypothetical protein [Marinobacterium marinum]MBA4500973.1 hypothetical protein [Marinobacterium marinum]
MKQTAISFFIALFFFVTTFFTYDVFVSSLSVNIVYTDVSEVFEDALYCSAGFALFGFVSAYITLALNSRQLGFLYILISVVALCLIYFVKTDVLIPDTEMALLARDLALYSLPYYLLMVVVPVFLVGKALLNGRRLPA